MTAIHVSGNLFRVGDTARTIVTRTSFCLMGHYQAGRRTVARRWLDRIQAQGFDGPRVFGENQDWFGDPGSPFFGTELTPKITAFGDLDGPFSSLELVDGYEGLVTQFAEDLAARNMVAEFCCIATIKGREPGWTGQGLNRFAQMFRQLFPDPHASPFLFETINEWDAHSVYATDPEEIARMGPRWLRSGNFDEDHHNYPGSTIGVSAGGQWTPGFDDKGYTHRNIHPPRGGSWKSGDRGEPLGVTLRELLASNHGRPLYLNETMHYMSAEQWEGWIPKVPKWAGLSTTEHDAIAQYIVDVRTAGASVCFHDMVGMMTDPSQPITKGELAVAVALGGRPPAPLPPEPPDPAPIDLAIRNIVIRGYRDMLFREPDPDGMKHYAQMILDGAAEARFREILLRDRLKGAR